MYPFKATKKFNILGGNETGVTLIETLVALAILGLIAVAFLSGLATAAKATIIADEQATAESLARSQMEYVKSQDYINYASPDYEEYELITTPASYSVEITAVPIDYGIQKITVTVNRGDKLVLTIEDYKVDRLQGE